MTKIKFPVLDVKMVAINKIVANNYNPNNVAPPEMKLLKLSIEQDGYTQPIVTYYDGSKYIVVDGWHRYRCAKEYFQLDEVPVVVINKNINERMASTIRHNRARGKHAINSMSDLVISLTRAGWKDSDIAKHLGMDAEEVLRLKQIKGLPDVFANHVFSKSWDEFEKKYCG